MEHQERKKKVKEKSKKPVVDWKRVKPKFSSQPENYEKHNESLLVNQLISTSEVGFFFQFFMTNL